MKNTRIFFGKNKLNEDLVDSVKYDMAGRPIVKLYRWEKENAYIAIVRDSLYRTKNSPIYYAIIPQSCDFDPKTGHYFPTAAKNIPMKSLEDAMKYVEKTWPEYEDVDFTGKLTGFGEELKSNKLHEDFQYDPKDIEKTADFLRYQYNLDDYNDSYYAAIEFFGSDDWYELRKAIRYAIEELDEAFEQLSDYNNKEARDYRLRTSKLINIWNQFAAIAQEEFRNAESDDDLYTLFKAIDTDGWAISNIPHSIISKIITN